MEGSALGNWLAGAAIFIFLALLCVVVARTVLLLTALLILPMSRAFQRLTRVGRAILGPLGRTTTIRGSGGPNEEDGAKSLAVCRMTGATPRGPG